MSELPLTLTNYLKIALTSCMRIFPNWKDTLRTKVHQKLIN